MVLGTDAFESLAAAAAAALERPHLPFVAVPHPIGGLRPDLVCREAEAVADRVIASLTREPRAPSAPAPLPDASAIAGPDDPDDFQAFALSQGWGDGLPLVPPTPARVARVLAGRTPGERVATLAPRHAPATLEAIAINAVLAGAGPEHFGVVVAAVRAVAEPRFNLNAVQTTTHPCTPLVIVNGPVALRLGINAAANALGQGHRANAVIGRALRLVLQNVGGARPGREDRATLGHPGKYSYCLAENEAASPWEPLHVERGFARDVSCVTVCAGEAPHNVNDHGSATGPALLLALAGTLATTGNNNVYLGGEPLVILGPEHARTLAAEGWSKREVARRLWERACVRLDRFSAENRARFAVVDPARFAGLPDTAPIPPSERPEDLMVIVAGGPGKHSAIVPTFGATRAVSVRVDG